MAMQLPLRQLNGEVMMLKVTPEMTGQELKMQIKEQRFPEDNLRRETTRVEVLVGESKLLEKDETVTGAGLSPDSELTVIFKENTVRCSNRDKMGQSSEIDWDLLIVVEVPDDVGEIAHDAFRGWNSLAKVTIPQSVTRIGNLAFACLLYTSPSPRDA